MACFQKCLVLTRALESGPLPPILLVPPHNPQLGPLSSFPLSVEYCHISYGMPTEVGTVAHTEKRCGLIVGCFSQGTIHQTLRRRTSVRARAHLQVPVWILQYEAEREECLSCSSIFLVSGRHASSTNIRCLWSEHPVTDLGSTPHRVKLVDLRMLGPLQRRGIWK